MLRLERLVVPSSVPWGIVIFAGAFLAQALSVTVGSVDGTREVVWLPAGGLLAALMRLPVARWLVCCVAAWIGVLLAQATMPVPAPAFETKAFASIALIAAGAYTVRQIHGANAVMRDLPWAISFLTLFGLLIPGLAAMVWTLTGGISEHAGSQPSDWLHVALCHALSFMLFAPLWLRLPQVARARVPDWRPFAIGVASAGAIAVLWVAFDAVEHSRLLLILAPVLAVALAALLGGAIGAYSFVALATLAALLLMIAGIGPFVEGDPPLSLLYIKSWSFAVAILGWLLVLLIEQQNEMKLRLDDSSREVRELAGRLFEAQEQERSRIARDLHDDINQRLALMSIELSSLRRHAGERERAELEHIQDELIALTEDVRDISHNLHPSMLQETGLTGALGSLCGAQRHRNGPSIDVHVAADADNLPAPIALCIYRVTQEALGNAIRHARAQHIEVRLRLLPAQVELMIDDDGVGFDVAGETQRRRGLGLFSLEERAKLLGGSFQLASEPGKGTRTCIRIPLPR